MIKIFYVLYVMIGGGSSTSIAIDHFDTESECYAAKAALIKGTDEWWSGRVFDRNAICVRAKAGL